MPTPADTTKHIIHSRGFTVTTTTVTTPPKKDGPDALAILTLVLPIATFLAGYYLNLIFENRKERKRLRDVKNFFLTLARSFVDSLYAQSILIQDTIARLQILSGNDLNVNLVSALRTTRIKAIPDIDLYKIFITDKSNMNKRTEQLYDISAQLDFVDDIKGLLSQINIDLQVATMNFHENYINKINEIVLSNHKKYLDIRPDLENADENTLNLIKLIHELLSVKSKEEKSYSNDIFDLHESLARPLYEAQELNDIKSTTQTVELLSLIGDLKIDYKNFKSKINTHIAELGKIAMQLDSSGKKIATILDEIS